MRVARTARAVLRIGVATVAPLLLAGAARAEIIDRIAVSVGNRVITRTDLEREIRVTAFLNGVKPDFGPQNLRATAQRMVEQKLVRRELELSRYPVPGQAEVEPGLRKFRQEHYPADAAYQAALAAYGITPVDVRDELLWQLTLLRFIELRFRPGVQVSDKEISDYFERVVRPAALKAHPGQDVTLEDYGGQVEETLVGERVDKEVDQWLTQARTRTEVIFHDEVLQ